MSDMMTKPVAELKKLLKQPLYNLVLRMQKRHATVVAELKEALALVEVHEATIVAGAHVIQSRNERTEMDNQQLLQQDKTNRQLSSDLEDARGENLEYQRTLERLSRQLREEQQAHQKTRDKVKTAPRIRIESTALLDMSKTGQDADSNLSEMFGDCDVTVTAPKKEERQPRRGVGDLMSILGRESGMSSGMRMSTPISKEILRKIAGAMSLRDMTECPVCHGTDPRCPIDGILSGGEGALSDCVHNGPGTNCEFCAEEECRFKGMPSELGELLTAKTGDGTLVFEEIIVMGGPSDGGFAMSDLTGRRSGCSGL